MSQRVTLLLGALAACVVQACVVPSPSGQTWDDRRYPEYDRDVYDDRDWQPPPQSRIDCGSLEDRIRFDRAKIAEIAPTNRHQKALQWYKDDLVNAQRDRDVCRDQGRDRWRDRRDDERERHEQEHERRDQERARREQERARCDKIKDRIHFDRAKIAEIDPNKHHKALQWYKDDLVNAQRDMESCRRR